MVENSVTKVGLVGLLVVLICLGVNVHSQVRAIAIGDTLSEMTIGPLVNGGDKINISLGKTAQRKAVIIDFWSTWCSSCVAAFPKLMKLKERFGEKLLILLVTKQDSATIAAFRKRNEFARELSLPMVVQDTLLHRYFPHRGVPHVV